MAFYGISSVCNVSNQPHNPPRPPLKGYVVLKRVADEDDVSTAKSLIWADLEGAYGVDRHEPETWAQSNWRLPISGLCANLAQTAGPWYLRGGLRTPATIATEPFQ